MSRPVHYDVRYEINPWMKIKNKVDKALALKQWQRLYDTYKSLGVEIELVDQAHEQPDMVFTANAGIVHNKTFISGNFRYKERKGEEKHFQKWFKDKKYKIKTLSSYQGGEGDALFYQDKLYMGWGFRSETVTHKEIADILKVPYVSLHLIDPYFYDFDTTFFPIGEKAFMYYPDAFDEESRKILEDTEGAIKMTKVQAKNFTGNSVHVNGKLLVGYLDRDLEKTLKKLNVEPILLDMSEFKKAGGGTKCCTLYLDRN